jgi:hypothetical protein
MKSKKFWCPTLGALVVSLLWFVKSYLSGVFNYAGEPSGVVVATVAIIIIVVCPLVGVIVRDTKEDNSLRLVLQGVALPSVIMNLAFSQLPASFDAPTGSESSLEAKTRPPVGPALSRLTVFHFGIATVSLAEVHGQGDAAAVEALEAPSLGDKLLWGLKGFIGARADNWYVEADQSRYLTYAQEQQVKLQELGFSAEVRTIPFSGGDGQPWLAAEPGAGDNTTVYSVFIASEVSQVEAQAQAREVQRHGFRAEVWQKPKLRERPYFQHSYESGLRDFNSKHWDAAAEQMRMALEAEPQNTDLGPRVQVEGLGPVCYLPHFYRSVAKANLGACKSALWEWNEATKRGVVPECKPEQPVDTFRLKACQAAASSDILAGRQEAAALWTRSLDPVRRPGRPAT